MPGEHRMPVTDVIEKRRIVVLEGIAAYVDADAKRGASCTPSAMERSLSTGEKLPEAVIASRLPPGI